MLVRDAATVASYYLLAIKDEKAVVLQFSLGVRLS